MSKLFPRVFIVEVLGIEVNAPKVLCARSAFSCHCGTVLLSFESFEGRGNPGRAEIASADFASLALTRTEPNQLGN